jgi:DNA-directed RNA polymerase specialized sigma24 family protein
MVWNSTKDLDWNAIYADQLPRVYNYFRFRLGRHTDIEDLTSRTFENAWRARAAYSNDLAAFSTWLFKNRAERRNRLFAVRAQLCAA